MRRGAHLVQQILQLLLPAVLWGLEGCITLLCKGLRPLHTTMALP